MPEEKTSVALTYVTIAAVTILVAFSAWLVLAPRPAPQPAATGGPLLTNEIVLSRLRSDLFGECRPAGIPESYNSCIVEIFKETEGEGWLARVTYNGLYDDSVQASRVEAYFVNRSGQWVVTEVAKTAECQAGRGHQDFSSELCV